MVRFPILSVLFLTSWTLWSAPVGTLVSLEGEVSVLRAGVTIPSEQVTEGFALEPFDTVTTGPTGRADFRFLPACGLTGVLRIDRVASLYLDMSSQKKTQTAGVELLSGSVTVRLTAAAGPSAVAVRTALGSYLGPGPVFRVACGDNGDNLVTSGGGKVQCRVAGQTVYADPGVVVEVQALDGSVVTRQVSAATVGSYETQWVRDRKQIFRDQSAAYFRVLGARYQLEVGLFQRAWDRVNRESKDDGQDSGAAVAHLRRAAGPLERSLFLVRALKGLLDEGILPPAAELSRGYTARDFFRQFPREDAQWSGRLGEARDLYKTVSESRGGNFPEVSGGPEITLDSPFFH